MVPPCLTATGPPLRPFPQPCQYAAPELLNERLRPQREDQGGMGRAGEGWALAGCWLLVP